VIGCGGGGASNVEKGYISRISRITIRNMHKDGFKQPSLSSDDARDGGKSTMWNAAWFVLRFLCFLVFLEMWFCTWGFEGSDDGSGLPT
jgi:hypothetical protein